MGFDVIKEIIKVEKEGFDILESAKADALEIQQQSITTAESIIAEAEKKAEEDYKRVLVEYEEQAGREGEHIIEENQLAKSEILNILPERWNKAVNLVIERIVSGIGNS